VPVDGWIASQAEVCHCQATLLRDRGNVHWVDVVGEGRDDWV
jgi:hypothetical protein